MVTLSREGLKQWVSWNTHSWLAWQKFWDWLIIVLAGRQEWGGKCKGAACGPSMYSKHKLPVISLSDVQQFIAPLVFCFDGTDSSYS